MSTTRPQSEDETYEEARIQHLMMVAMAYSSRRSNREPPQVISRRNMFFDKSANQSEHPAPAPKDAPEKNASCWSCLKKK